VAGVPRSGLAQRGRGVSDQPDFSTHPTPGRPPFRLVVALGLAVLALAGSIYFAWFARRDARVARERLAGVQREVGDLQARIQAYRARSAAGGDLLTRAAAAGESPPEKIVAELARVLPGAARLERVTITYGDTIALEMAVVARDAAAWDRTLKRLEAIPFIEDVSLGPERREGEVRTTVSARWVERRR